MTATAPTLRQYITWKLAPDPKVPGKMTKHPADHRDGRAPVSAQRPDIWTTYEHAKKRAGELGQDYGVGFAITESDQYAFIDLDHCLTKDANGTPCWSAFALQIIALFPGAYVEISPSGEGLHILFKYMGRAPAHAKKPREGLEFYTEKRFTTMTGTNAMGDAGIDHTEAMMAFIQAYALPSADEAAGDVELTDEPRPEWSGPADNAALLKKMLASRSAHAVFGGKATFRQLWERDVAKLAAAWPTDQPGKDFDYSSADLAMANHLAFWTGCHGTRMADLMKESGLNRDKLDREDYLHDTISKACTGCTKVYNNRAPDGVAKVHAEGCDGANTSTPWPTARLFLTAHFMAGELPTLLCWNKDFYHFQNGIYVPVSKESIRAKVYPFLEAAGETATPDNVSAVVDALASSVYLNEKIKVPSLLNAPDVDMSGVIVARNGAFNLDLGIRYPITPNIFALNALPFDYDPNAPDPVEWLKFLNTQWANDPESIQTLQEVGGLLLTPVTRFQKLFFLVGPRRSGKGTILRTWSQMLGGTDNVVGPTLGSLTQQFGLQPLIGKLAAFIGDVRLSPNVDQSKLVERLLSLTGEDALSVPRKNLTDWNSGLFARLVLASNELPHFSDASGAAAGRVLMLWMKTSFFNREDTGLGERLKAELPQILAWHIRGRQRLFARGHFIQPESAREKIQQLEDMGMPVAVFLREHCNVGPGLQVSKDDLYAAWRMHCITNGLKPTDSATLGKDLFASVAGLKDGRQRCPDGKQRQFYFGIALVNVHMGLGAVIPPVPA
jgi:putative DNA primase/helicase